MKVKSLNNLDCPDCDENGLDTHDKVCDHAWLRERYLDAVGMLSDDEVRCILPAWKRELSDATGVDHNG